MRSSIAETTKISSGAKRSNAYADTSDKEANHIGEETGKFSRKAKGAFVSESALHISMAVSRILSA